MFRQIKVNKLDVDWQRILWSPNSRETARHFQLLTVTYDTACAPYLSLRTLQQLCDDESDKFPRGRIAALSLTLRDELIQLMKAGYPLGKWVANHPRLLEDLDADDRLRPAWMTFTKDEPVKELGVRWSPQEDTLGLNFPIDRVVQWIVEGMISSESDRDNKGGGTAILVNSSRINCSFVPLASKLEVLECTVIKINLFNNKSLFVIGAYASPTGNISIKTDLDKLFEELKLNKISNEYILIGDLNAKHFNWNNPVSNNNSRGRQLNHGSWRQLGSVSRPVSGRGKGERFSAAQRRSHSDFSRERKWLRRNVRGFGEVARRENDAGRELINLVVV
ncbi:unnamed protein product [Trichogramma brassicae]|uniref:Uncharacterized protein n=1 Tax=Trichogramma brassicae TaxID=86971 RepID=A0A6H5J0T5_9HYME|nr:unnamed protein product [Trichogramma brassicae]